ncbi:MAG: hypothetical protein VX751_02485, partial [Pseudomonadota bacterium]|nr:hypothetical protein [Pseudomonadota bacterium]
TPVIGLKQDEMLGETILSSGNGIQPPMKGKQSQPEKPIIPRSLPRRTGHCHEICKLEFPVKSRDNSFLQLATHKTATTS